VLAFNELRAQRRKRVKEAFAGIFFIPGKKSVFPAIPGTKSIFAHQSPLTLFLL